MRLSRKNVLIKKGFIAKTEDMKTWNVPPVLSYLNSDGCSPETRAWAWGRMADINGQGVDVYLFLFLTNSSLMQDAR